MLGYGVSAVLYLLDYGALSEAVYTAAPIILALAGGLKIVAAILGIVSTFVKWKPLVAIVRLHPALLPYLPSFLPSHPPTLPQTSLPLFPAFLFPLSFTP